MYTLNSLLTKTIKQPLKKAYDYLFEYNLDKISIYRQFSGKILALLTYAILHRSDIMITFQDGKTVMGKITKRLASDRFVLRDEDAKILRIVYLDDIFRIDLA